MWHAFIVISHVNKMRFLYSFLLVIYIYIELASERAVSGGGDYARRLRADFIAIVPSN